MLSLFVCVCVCGVDRWMISRSLWSRDPWMTLAMMWDIIFNVIHIALYWYHQWELGIQYRLHAHIECLYCYFSCHGYRCQVFPINQSQWEQAHNSWTLTAWAVRLVIWLWLQVMWLLIQGARVLYEREAQITIDYTHLERRLKQVCYHGNVLRPHPLRCLMLGFERWVKNWMENCSNCSLPWSDSQLLTWEPWKSEHWNASHDSLLHNTVQVGRGGSSSARDIWGIWALSSPLKENQNWVWACEKDEVMEYNMGVLYTCRFVLIEHLFWLKGLRSSQML